MVTTAGKVCTLCAGFGVFRWLDTCIEIGHHDRVFRGGCDR